MAAILARVLRGEWRRARPFIRAGRVPPFRGFLERLTIALRPLLIGYYLRGHGDEVKRNSTGRREPKIVQKDIALPQPVDVSSKIPGVLALAGIAYAVDRAIRRIWTRVTTRVTQILFKPFAVGVPLSPVGTPANYYGVPVGRSGGGPRGGSSTGADREEAVGRIFDKPYAADIAEEEATRLHHEGQIDAAKEAGRQTHRWRTSFGACQFCLKLEAVGPVAIGQPFGTRSDGVAIYTPPAHPHCLLPETPIIAPVGIAGVEAHYDGPVVQLDFADGSGFSMTPNHMLLTPTGFARAKSLVKGDDVIRCINPQSPSGVDPNDDWQPTAIKKVVETWAKSLGVMSGRVPVSPEYLHGDAAFCQGQIDVVRPHGLLRDSSEAGGLKPVGHDLFVNAFDFGNGFAANSRVHQLLMGLRAATDGGVRRAREFKASLWGHFRHTDKVGFAAAADGPSGTLQAADDCRAGDAGRIGKCQDRFPGFITTNQIVNVQTRHYCGPVYDVETLSSLYLAGNGVVSSNCRCSLE